MVAPAMVRQSGWSLTQVSGAFSAGLLVSGLSAPTVAAMLARFGPRAVMTAGSILTVISTILWAWAPSIAVLYGAWMLIGVAMAATLYEPAIVVLTLLDSRHMRRTISIITVAGGLASTVFVPLTEHLVATFGWRVAITVLGCSAGTLTAALHRRYLPRNNGAHHDSAPPPHEGSGPSMATSRPMRRLHIAYMLEQGSAVAATALVVTMLIDRGVDPRVAALVLAVTGAGKVGGRLLLAGRIGQAQPHLLAGGAAGLQAIAVISTLASTSTAWLFAAALASGIAAGTSSVLRPLMIAHHVPLYRFASASARLQTSTTLTRAAGPVIVASAAPYAGWTGAWALVASGLTAAAGTFAALEKRRRGGSVLREAIR
ncbi:MFS transporter [Mycobacterium sp. ITM-2016-00318]|nr:MFS transporter [Mycobacterium sp. ITM-2016-00318]WNG95480.1 MFS transporter [Mycobacterium sp. ITM-2016-00318]